MGIPEEEKETGTESICKALWLKTCQTWGEKWTSRSINTPNRQNLNRAIPRYIIIKLANVKDKEKILRAAGEKRKVTYKGNPIRLGEDFSTETFQARK